MKKTILALSLALAGCGEPEKTMMLIDPASGCQYVATMYAQGGLMAGSYVKPVTDSKGKQRCEVPHA
jgi:hypothetical protein